MHTILKMISQIFTVFVDYSRSIEESVKIGQYAWTDKYITSDNFPIAEHNNVGGEKEMTLFHFSRIITPDEMIVHMKTKGYRPADMRELLAFGEKYPESQRQFPVVALGQVVILGGYRRVGYLYWRAIVRELGLKYYDYDWSDYFRFLAVKIES